jgi:hypothetical protein
MDFAFRRDIMPTAKTVTFDFDGVDTLTSTSDPVELEPGDWVEWNFSNAPSGSLPIIEFDSPLGPFQCLQFVEGSIVQGKGNVGEEDGEGTLYNYKAFLLDDTGVVATSATSAVRNLPQPLNTSPLVVVTITETEDPNRVLNLDVQPTDLTLFPGDTALWHVFGLPPGTFVSFQFTSQNATVDPMIGPFDSMVVNRRVGEEEAGVMRILGVNFTPAQGTYTYQLAVRDASGTILASEDPVIDSLGDPGPPSEES